MNEARPTVNVYVDGFNLYRRLLDDRPACKWLDLEALTAQLLPEYRVNRVRYFTARIRSGLVITDRQRANQNAYLRALETCDRTTIHYGNFLRGKRTMPVVPQSLDPDGRLVTQKVVKIEEKGSDVNLASYFLLDAMRQDADLFAILTNDSDLVTPLKLAKHELRVRTGLILPVATEQRSNNELRQTNPDVMVCVSESALLACQLPDEIPDSHGVIHRPPTWR